MGNGRGDMADAAIGDKLRRARVAAGKSQAELAEGMAMLGVTLSAKSLSTVELGRRSLSYAEGLAAARTLNVPPDTFAPVQRVTVTVGTSWNVLPTDRELADLVAQLEHVLRTRAAGTPVRS